MSIPVLWFCDDCNTSGCFIVHGQQSGTIPARVRDEHESTENPCMGENVTVLGQVKGWLQFVRREFPG